MQQQAVPLRFTLMIRSHEFLEREEEGRFIIYLLQTWSKTY